jgi:hypothetical protein
MKRLAFLLLLLSTRVDAQVFNDGGSHVVNGAADSIQITAWTSVTIVDPASVTNGVRVDAGSTLGVQGGKILGANAFGPGSSAGNGITSQGLFTGSAGLVLGGTSVDDLGTGGNGLGSFGSTQISGGTYQGGGGSPLDGYGGDGLAAYASGLLITGGVFQGGAAAHDGIGASILGDATGKGTIAGGLFSGFRSLTFTGMDSSELDITGGSFQGSIYASLFGTSSLRFFGTNLQFDPTSDLLTGQLLDGSLLNVSLQSYGVHEVDRSSREVSFLSSSVAIAAPEPASIITLATGMAAVLFSLLRRSRSDSQS